MSRQKRIVILRARNLARQLLESLPLSLRDQKRRKQTHQHEECENLHDVIEPWGIVGPGCSAARTERAEDALSDDGTDFAGCGADAVGGGAVAGGETLAGDDECCCVGAFWGRIVRM